jgi:pectate lyase
VLCRAVLALAAALTVACGDAKLYPYTKKPVPPADCSDMKLGFAAVASSGADGGVSEATTGGNGGQTMIVNRADMLTAALQSHDPLVIYLDGMLPLTETIKVTVDKTMRGGNKTLIGMGDSSGFTGAGLDLSYTDNVIVQNLKIAKAAVGEGDAITILNAHHIWIDHCDLSSDRYDTTSGYDGLVDITHGSSFVTVSWTLFHDHKDTSLVGHTNDPAQQAEDKDLSVTYHHNGFFRVNSGPRIRWGTAQVANNHFDDVTSFGIVSDSAATVFVASNMFEDNVGPPDTHLAVTTSYGDPTPGTMIESGDRFPRGFTLDIMRPTVAPPPLPYSYNADSAESVSPLITTCAGTGKLVF